MDKKIDEWLNGYKTMFEKDRWMVGWTEKKNRRMVGGIETWMAEWIEKNRWMVGRTGKKQKDGCMDIKNGWMVGWIDKTNRWMVGRKTQI